MDNNICQCSIVTISFLTTIYLLSLYGIYLGIVYLIETRKNKNKSAQSAVEQNANVDTAALISNVTNAMGNLSAGISNLTVSEQERRRARTTSSNVPVPSPEASSTSSTGSVRDSKQTATKRPLAPSKPKSLSKPSEQEEDAMIFHAEQPADEQAETAVTKEDGAKDTEKEEE